VTTHIWLLVYVIGSRLAELIIARRNTRRLLAQGGHEVGRRHYPLIVILHVSWILALALLVPTDTPAQLIFLIPFLLLQIVRYWVLHSLDRRWTTRIIILPEAPLVKQGPYRWLRHPNYLVVVAEIALLPLVFGAWEMAIGFSLANAVLLGVRIHAEDRALHTHK